MPDFNNDTSILDMLKALRGQNSQAALGNPSDPYAQMMPPRSSMPAPIVSNSAEPATQGYTNSTNPAPSPELAALLARLGLAPPVYGSFAGAP